MRDVDTYLLRAFVEVADAGTVSGAARSLNRTQAAISMQIRRLEDLLSAHLFVRTSRGLRLANDGMRLLPHAKRLLSSVEEMHTELSRDRERIRLGVVEDFAASELPGILRDFKQRHPAVDIDLFVAGNRPISQMFSRRSIDVAICDVVSLADVTPIQRWRIELLWTAQIDWRIEAGGTLPIVMFEEGCSWRSRAIASLEKVGRPWKLSCEASTLVAMSTAVSAGAGIGLMFESTIPSGCAPVTGVPGLGRLPIDLGIYLHAQSSRPSRYLADSVRHEARAPERLPRGGSPGGGEPPRRSGR